MKIISQTLQKMYKTVLFILIMYRDYESKYKLKSNLKVKNK